MNRKIHVVVPVYNCPFSIVSRTIRSVIAQDYESLRITVIDDCSERSLFDALVNEFSYNPRLSLIRNEKNIGFANTLNKALELVKDEQFFFILEHDCELLSPNYISQAVKRFEDDKVGAVCGENQLPCSEELSLMKRVFIAHLNEDVHDSIAGPVGFLLLKADVFRTDVLRQVGGFESAGHWKFACEEHIISHKIRLLSYTILKDPNLLFKAYWGGQENLRQNLRKEALYGRGLGCAFASRETDLDIGSSHQLKSKKNARFIQLLYIGATILSLPFLLFYPVLGVFLAGSGFFVYLVFLIKRSLVFGFWKLKLLFIITGYLRAWVYITNFCLGIFYGAFIGYRKVNSDTEKSSERKV